jgi:peroxiredoxin
MSIAVGQTAPDFTLMNQDKKEVKLSDFAGKKNVVLVFYPLDWSPTCTNEHACFVNDMRSFDTLDAEVLGVSVDSIWSHKAYAEKMSITGRSIIIINKAGKVAWSKDYDIPVVPDLKEVAAALSQVKTATA